MSKYKKLLISFIIIISIISISYAIYAIVNQNNDNSNTNNEKILSEIKYLENKLINMLNTLNNIEYKNYKISVEEQNTVNKNDSNISSDSNSSNSNNSSSKQNSNSTDENSKKYILKTQGVFTNSENINWESIKKDVELLYSLIPGLTLDLYQFNFNKDDILNFNKQLDLLSLAVKKENKESVLFEMTKLYSYIPKFLQNIDSEELYKISIKTKVNVFEAYSILDSEDWQLIDQKISNAINEFEVLLTGTNDHREKQYNINKCYIMLNELKNSIENKDKEVFLIKYKNLLEEINNI